MRRSAEKYGLDGECLEVFDIELERGEEEPQAAWNALYEWDVLPPEDIIGCIVLNGEPTES